MNEKDKQLMAFIRPNAFRGYSDFIFDLNGTHNGYVAIPPMHPCHGYGYDRSPVKDLDVHGSITYSEPVIFGESLRCGIPVNPEYIGKRNSILEDAEYITDETDIPDDWWILGFDTCHLYDTPDNWGEQEVIEETLRLKEQLEQFKY